MNKAELIAEVSKVVSSAKEAKVAVNTVFNIIMKSLKKGQSVTIVGFGTFKVVKRAARKGNNPRTGESIKIKATKAPKFVPGKPLKDAVKK
jgi:DNA-binding protein HU-beta